MDSTNHDSLRRAPRGVAGELVTTVGGGAEILASLRDSEALFHRSLITRSLCSIGGGGRRVDRERDISGADNSGDNGGVGHLFAK